MIASVSEERVDVRQPRAEVNNQSSDESDLANEPQNEIPGITDQNSL